MRTGCACVWAVDGGGRRSLGWKAKWLQGDHSLLSLFMFESCDYVGLYFLKTTILSLFLQWKRIPFIYFFRGGEGREKERGRNISVWEKHWLVASCTPQSGDLAHNPGMCPDQELNQRPFSSLPNTQSTEPHQPGLKRIPFKEYSFLWAGGRV